MNNGVSRRAGRVGLVRGLLLASLAGTVLSARAVAQTDVHWAAPVSGLWSDAGKWAGGVSPNNGTPPGAVYRAFLSATGANHTVTSMGDVSLFELTLSSAQAQLHLNGGTMTVPTVNLGAGTLWLNGGTLAGSTINATGGVLQTGHYSSVLDGVTINGTLTTAGTNIRNGITVNGQLNFYSDVLLSGSMTLNGNIAMRSDSYKRLRIEQGETVTLAAGSTLKGKWMLVGGEYTDVPRGTLINNGTIEADEASNGPVWLLAQTLTNNGTLRASGGGRLIASGLMGDVGTVNATGAGSSITLDGTYTLNNPVSVASGAALTLNGAWTNTAGITATGGSRVVLGGPLTSASFANITRTGGSKMVLAGAYDNAGQTLTINAANPDYELAGGSITGGTLATADGQGLVVTSGTLTGVSNTGLVSLTAPSGVLTLGGAWSNAGGTIAVTGSNARLNLNGTFTTAGLGTLQTGAGNDVVVSGAMDNTGATFTLDAARARWQYTGGSITGGTVHLGSGAVLRGVGAAGVTLNDVTLTGGATLQSTTIYSTDLVNQSALVLQNSGATLRLDGDWVNTGTIQLNGGIARVGGTYTRADLAGFSVINGGQLYVTGELDNSGGTLSTAQVGELRLDGGTITGGTLTGADLNPRLRVHSATNSRLHGLTVSGNVIADDWDGQVETTLFLSGGAAINGTVNSTVGLIDVDAASAINGAVTLRGGGSLNLHGTRTHNQAIDIHYHPSSTVVTTIGIDAGETLTIGAAGTISGGGARVVRLGETGTATLVNNGLIRSTFSDGGGLLVEPDVVVNNGVLEAYGSGILSVRNLAGNLNTARINGGTLTLDGAYTINTPLTATGGGTLNLNGDWTNTAGIVATNTTVNLGGSFTQAEIGTVTRSGSTSVNIAGVLDNTGGTLTLDNAATLIGLRGGTIQGGTVAASNGQKLEQRSGGSLLAGVTVNGDVAVLAGTLTADGATTLNGEVIISSGAAMQFPSWATAGTGTFTFNASSGNALLRAVPEAGGTTLTLGSDVIVRGGNGLIGEAGTAITSNGLISANTNGRTITVQGASFSNGGIIEAVDGGRLVVNGVTGNLGTARSLGTGSALTLSGTYTLNEPVQVTTGSLTLNGTWTNTAGVVAHDATVNLGGAFTTAGIGSITATGTTLVNITGAMDNTGATLTVDSAVGAVGLAGGSITGGTIATANGQSLTQRSGSSALAGVQVTGSTLVAGGTLNADDATVFAGPITVGAGTLNLETGSTLTGDVFLNGATAGALRSAGGTLTLGSTAVVHGGGGTVGLNTADLITNNGLIRADVAGQTLWVKGDLENAGGRLEATNGGTLLAEWVRSVGQVSVSGANSFLVLAGHFTNTSTIDVTDGGRLGLSGQWVNNGTVNITNGTLDMWGSAAGAALFSNINNNGGQVRVMGRVDARGTTVTVPSGLNLDVRAELWTESLAVPANELVTVSTGGVLSQGTLLGSGHIRLQGGNVSGRPFVSGGLTIPSTYTISGYGGVNAQPLVNNGTILADVPGQTLGVSGSSFTNNGLLEGSNGGTLSLGGNWTNAGTIRTRDTSTMFLSGNYSFSGGTIEALDSSQIRLGGVLDNTGSTFTAAGNVLLEPGLWVLGGTINVPGTPLRINPASNFSGQLHLRNGVALNGELHIAGNASPANRQLNVHSGLSGTGTVRLTGASYLGFENSQTISGVTIFSDGTADTLTRKIGHRTNGLTVTLSPTATIRGGNATLFDISLGGGLSSTLVNNGTVRADLPGQLMHLQPGTMTNNGVLEATNGGILHIGEFHGDPLTTWTSGATGVVRASSGGTLRIGGIATLENGFENDGGTVELWGRLINTGRTLTLSGGNQSMAIRGNVPRIVGGTIDNTGGGLSIPASDGSVYLEGVNVIGGVTNFTDLHLLSGTNISGVMRLEEGSNLYFGLGNSQAPWVLDNDEIHIAHGGTPTSSNRIRIGANNLVIGAESWVHGGGGYFSAHPLANSSVGITNYGRISADVPGQVLQIGLTNYGTLEAINGGHLAVGGTFHPSTVLRQINSSMSLQNVSTWLVNSMERVGGTMSFSGSLENTGDTLTLDPTTIWRFENASRIKGGTLNVPAGTNLYMGHDTTFDGITVNGTLRVTDAEQILMRSGVTLNGLIDLYKPNSKVVFVGDQSFNSGTIFFNPDGGVGERQVTLRGPAQNGAGYATLTFGPNAVLRGGDGKIRLAWGFGALGSFINYGLVSADIAGKQLAIEQQRFVNFGTVQAINGGIIAYQGPALMGDSAEFSNMGSLRVTGGSQIHFGMLTLDSPGSVLFALTEGGLGSILASEINFDGALVLEAESGVQFSFGERLPLFTFEHSTGQFASITLPELGGGLVWDLRDLYVDGSVRVVPSPGAGGLIGVGLLAAARRRRRS
ncbi:MAG TPA: hypothetical protein VD997_12035 [Phycisphaerales bacterium]|nr:hypothetical protein [Phycisphaerales bacterium]